MIIYYDQATGQILRWCSAELAPDVSTPRLEVPGYIADFTGLSVVNGAIDPPLTSKNFVPKIDEELQ